MRLMIALFLLLPPIFAQPQTIPFAAPAPPPVEIVSVRASTPGTGNYCWWVVARYPIGKASPSPPTCQGNIGGTVTVTWNPMPAAIDYAVLRTTVPTLPLNAGALIAVATGVVGNSQTDTLGTPSAYTLTAAPSATGYIRLDNLTGASPAFDTSPSLGGFANPMSTLGDIIIGGALGAPTRLAGNITATQKCLSQTGDGVNSAAPSWQACSGAGVSSLTGTPNQVAVSAATGGVTVSIPNNPVLPGAATANGTFNTEKSVLACGVVGDKSTDDTTALNNCIAALPDYYTLVIPAGFKIKITSTINIAGHIGIVIKGLTTKFGGPSSSTAAPAIYWAGADGGTMLDIEDTGTFTIEGVALFTSLNYASPSTAGADVAINVDQTAMNTVTTTGGTFDRVVITNPTHRSTFKGLVFAATSGSNVEDMRVVNSTVNCSYLATPAVGVGITIGAAGSNAFEHFYQHNGIFNCLTGINILNGFALVDGNELNSNVTHIHSVKGITVTNNDTEHATQFYTGAPGGRISSNRVASVVPAAGHGQIETAGSGTLILENNVFDGSGTNIPVAALPNGTNGAMIASRGNTYNDCTPSLAGLATFGYGATSQFDIMVGCTPATLMSPGSSFWGPGGTPTAGWGLLGYDPVSKHWQVSEDGAAFKTLANVSNSGTPTAGQLAEWVTATTAKGVAYPTLCAGAQFSQGLSTGSNNCATPAGGGNVSNTGTPVIHQIGIWTAATVQKGLPTATIDDSGNAALNSLALGASPPAVTFGTGGAWVGGEGTAPSVGFPAAGVDGCYMDSAAHAVKCSFNNDTLSAMTRTIASGTSALGTAAIAGNACASVVTTSATGTASTDAISWTPNADISGVTGYGKASTDGLGVYPYPTANNVNWVVCNLTGTSITPGAVTLNWRVMR